MSGGIQAKDRVPRRGIRESEDWDQGRDPKYRIGVRGRDQYTGLGSGVSRVGDWVLVSREIKHRIITFMKRGKKP